MRLAGAVLAGGRSQRMGSDKARLVWRGQPLWRQQLGVLREAGARPVALVRRPDQSALARRCWRDRHRGRGPLAGLGAALDQAALGGADHLAVLAVDMPNLGPDWFGALAARLRPARGVVARHGRIFEPLAAIYPVAAQAAVRARLRGKNWSLQELVRQLVAEGLLEVLPVSAALLPALRSVNTPDTCRSNTAKSLSRRRGRGSTK